MIDLTPFLDSLNATFSGWIDSSYGNDACQSVAFPYSDASRLKLWIDAENPSERESDFGGRFILARERDNDFFCESIMITDDWQSIVNFIVDSHFVLTIK